MDIKNLLLEIQEYNLKIISLLDIIKNILKENNYYKKNKKIKKEDIIPIKPLTYEYTSTAGEHTDKYNKDVFNDANIENLTINEILEEPTLKKSNKKTPSPINKSYNSTIDKPQIEYNKKIKKNKSKKETSPIIIEKIKAPIKPLKLTYNSIVEKPDQMIRIIEKLDGPQQHDISELLEMIDIVKNTKIKISKKDKDELINKQIKKIEKIINKSEEEPEPKPKKEPKKEKKPKKKISDDDSSEDEEDLKNEEHNKKIMMMEQQNELDKIINKNIKLIDDQSFKENTKETLKEAAELLYTLQNEKFTDANFLKFVDKYLNVPNISLKDKQKIKLLKERLNLK
jgi:hypothetical protein